MNYRKLYTQKKRHSSIWRKISQFAIAVLATSTLGIQATSYAIDFNDGVSVNLGSGFTVPIIDNNGQLPPSISFVAPGPTGNTLYFHNNAEIGFALRGYNGAGNSFTTLSHVGASGTAAFESGDVLPSETHYFSGSNISLPTSIANHSFVAAGNLYSGVSAQFSVNGRQLIAQYTVDAGTTTEEIILHFDDINNTVLNAATGDAELTFAPERVVLLHSARVSIGASEDEFVPFTTDANGDLVLDISNVAASGQSAVITVKITFGPYYHDYGAVADESDNIVATSTGFNTMVSGAGDSGADILITRLNSTGTEVLSTTIIAGEGDDVAYSVAVAESGPCGGGIYAAGLTSSTEFPVDGTRLGAEDAYIMKLTADATAIESGTIISASGRDVAHHVIICGCDVIVVGATDGGLADVSAAGMDFTTTFPAVASSDKVQTYFLAYLNADATEITNRISLAGPAIGMPMKVGCSGGSVEIGVASGDIATSSCDANYTSEMLPWFDQPCYAGTDAGKPHWGQHALCWKGMVSLTHSFTSTCSSLPFGNVQKSHAGVLNDREANIGSTCFNCGGCNFDPFGVWHANRYDDYSTNKAIQAAELVLGAAYYQELYHSPVYANWNPDPYNTMAFLIRRVHLKVEDVWGNPANFKDVCDTQFKNAKNGDMFDAACLTGLNGHIIVCSMDVVPWRMDALSVSNYPQVNWDANTITNNISSWGVYIADPPEDEPVAAGNIQEMANRMSRSISAVANVETVTYDNGVATNSTTATRPILMAALHAPGQPAALPTSVDETVRGFAVSSPFGMIQSKPNPASGEITVTYQVLNAAVLQLEVYNAMGQKVDVVSLGYRHPHQYSLPYDTSDLPSGTYYLHLSSDQGRISMPIIVAH